MQVAGQEMRVYSPLLVMLVALIAQLCSPAAAAADLSPVASASNPTFRRLAPMLAQLANRLPGTVAVSIVDLSDGRSIGINADANLPAASVIKIPIMVEVFRQVATGRFTLSRTVSLTDEDRDDGFGDLADARWGAQYTVRDLLWAMITESDNTAANMLIRLVGRRNINQTMAGLGLEQTRLGDYIRSDGDVRELRTSANDMTRLLWMIAGHRIVNARSCDFMLKILAAQQHNTLLPEPLPRGLWIAHKTGTLRDTLNDVGIVDLEGAPYIICVFTTHLRDLDDGEAFIRRASLLTFRAFAAHIASAQ